MSALDLAAVMLAIVALVAVGVLAVVCARLTRLVRELRESVGQVSAVVPTATAELSDAADRAALQVDRLERLISTTGSITDAVDTATQVTLRALSSPVIKGAAIASGTRGAARKLRGRPRGEGNGGGA